ncbi:MAG TPA: hypothetical protein VFD41_09360 [Actinomycetales bacterium]|nr:hypothetical protein [Actinomycetales bacterium]
MSTLPRPIATALLTAFLVIAPVGLAAGEPTGSPTTTQTETTSPEPTSTETTTADATPTETMPSTATATPTPELTTTPTVEEADASAAAAERTTPAVPHGQTVAAADLPDPPGAAADWLVSQLTDSDHYVGSYPCGTPGDPDAICTFEDYGLTADGVLALVAAGGHQADVTAMTDYLAANADAYVTAFGTSYAGSIAKLLLIATVTDRDPRAFGGHDLVADLEEHRGTVEAGRYSDIPADFDSSNAIVQSLAIIALARAGETVPNDAVAFLIDQQCPDGGFQAQFPTDDGACASDPDTTGFALQALAAAGGTGAAGDAAVAARIWLRDTQLADGHWDAEGTVNATALASVALLLVGDDTQASLNWLEAAQLADGSLPVNPGAQSGDGRATTQAVLTLAGESLLSVGPGGTARVSLVGNAPTEVPPAAQSPAEEPAAAPDDGGLVAGEAGTTGALARTGADPLLPSATAVLLVLAGAGLVLVSRRRPARTAGGHRDGASPR